MHVSPIGAYAACGSGNSLHVLDNCTMHWSSALGLHVGRQPRGPQRIPCVCHWRRVLWLRSAAGTGCAHYASLKTSQAYLRQLCKQSVGMHAMPQLAASDNIHEQRSFSRAAKRAEAFQEHLEAAFVCIFSAAGEQSTRWCFGRSSLCSRACSSAGFHKGQLNELAADTCILCCRAVQRDGVPGAGLHAGPGRQPQPEGASQLSLPQWWPSTVWLIHALLLVLPQRRPKALFLRKALASRISFGVRRCLPQSRSGEGAVEQAVVILQAVLSIIDNWQITDNNGAVSAAQT